MSTVCVFTPTYNRAYTLTRLYESLERQTCRDFEWLVVDDGSTDGTEELVASFKERGCVTITYLKVENGGKQRAHDLAVSRCRQELFFVLDSDDYLTDDAIETIVTTWREHAGDPSVGGILALKGWDAERPLGTRMPANRSISTQWGLYNSGFKGDISLIYRTDVLRQFPFEVDEGEKFIPETYTYYRIDQRYVCVLVDKIITVCEYLPDGYTKAFPRNVIASPKGYLRHKRLCMEMSEGFVPLLKSTVLYLVACRLNGQRNAIREAKSLPVALLAYLPARVLCATVFKDGFR